jgi:hypothetical protein
MRPLVRVPVLSVQITSVEPSVSTAVRRYLYLERAGLGAHTLGEGGYSAELRPHACRVDDRLGLAPVSSVSQKTRSSDSRGEAACPELAAERATGWDSPVRGDISTSTEPSIRRASAESLSPSESRMRSPGTRVETSTSRARPSRRTRACSA